MIYVNQPFDIRNQRIIDERKIKDVIEIYILQIHYLQKDLPEDLAAAPYFNHYYKKIKDEIGALSLEDEKKLLLAFLLIINEYGAYEDLDSDIKAKFEQGHLKDEVLDFYFKKKDFLAAAAYALSVDVRLIRFKEAVNEIKERLNKEEILEILELDFYFKTHIAAGQTNSIRYKARHKAIYEEEKSIFMVYENALFESKLELIKDESLTQREKEELYRLSMLRFILADLLLYAYIDEKGLKQRIKDEPEIIDEIWMVFDSLAQDILAHLGLSYTYRRKDTTFSITRAIQAAAGASVSMSMKRDLREGFGLAKTFDSSRLAFDFKKHNIDLKEESLLAFYLALSKLSLASKDIDAEKKLASDIKDYLQIYQKELALYSNYLKLENQLNEDFYLKALAILDEVDINFEKTSFTLDEIDYKILELSNSSFDDAAKVLLAAGDTKIKLILSTSDLENELSNHILLWHLAKLHQMDVALMYDLVYKLLKRID